MEKIIFFGLVIPILAFVLYLGGTAIMKGFSAKNANKSIERDEEDTEDVRGSEDNTNQLSSELNKLSGQLLHAKTLEFKHPTKNKIVKFKSNLPNEFEKMLKLLNNTNS